ncbi:hypothetical protein D3C81_1488180 [compost metagenome]
MQPASAVQAGHRDANQAGAEDEAQGFKGAGEDQQQADAGGNLGQGLAVQRRLIVLVHDGSGAYGEIEQAQAHQPKHQQRVGAWADRFVGKGRLVGPGHHGQDGAQRQQSQGEDALQDHWESSLRLQWP